MLDLIEGSTAKTCWFLQHWFLLATVSCGSTSSSYTPLIYAEPASGAELVRVS